MAIAAGWYRDPWRKACTRYWDGQQWTGYTAESHASHQVSEFDLRYDSWGTRLRAIGSVELTYRKLGSRPRTLGAWRLDYDTLGSRLRQIGPFHIDDDVLGSRERTIGPMTIHYDSLGSRPKRVELSRPKVGQLPEECMLALFFVLYEQRREQERTRGND
jgi:Protein of unknown function (DUF2510)